MTRFKQGKSPVLIVVDDGGFPSVNAYNPDNPGEEIPFDVYKNLLKLARQFEIRIPICFTMRYLDVNNVSGCAEPPSYATELVDLVKNNQEYIEIGYHGLTHHYQHHVGEFYMLDIHTPVPEEVQREHIHKSSLIFNDLGLDFPELFVPPYHAWELGVTDKLLAEQGVKYLVSNFQVRHGRQKYRLSGSRYLMLLPREDMGIWSNDVKITVDKLKMVKRWLLPRSILDNFRFSLKLSQKPVHSYMTHIGNFMNASYEFWEACFKYAQQDPSHELSSSSAKVISKYFHAP